MTEVLKTSSFQFSVGSLQQEKCVLLKTENQKLYTTGLSAKVLLVAHLHQTQSLWRRKIPCGLAIADCEDFGHVRGRPVTFSDIDKGPHDDADHVV